MASSGHMTLVENLLDVRNKKRNCVPLISVGNV